MLDLRPKYVIDNDGNKVAVQLPIETYKKIEETLENFGLYKLMKEARGRPLNITEASKYYDR